MHEILKLADELEKAARFPAYPPGPYLKAAAALRSMFRQLSTETTKGVAMQRDQIREIFVKNGFTVKEGQTDLKDYVYKAAEDLLAASKEPLPLETAPKDGTIVRLLVEFEHGNLEDTPEPQWTIGENSFQNTGEDNWQFAGWNWTHDCFCEGTGKVIGWLPLV